MRLCLSLALAFAAGCVGNTINAGSNGDGGASAGRTNSSAVTSPFAIASEIQQTPIDLASNGRSVFWVSFGGPVDSVPVGGGSVATVVPVMAPGSFVAADDTYVYYELNGGIYRAPIDGSGPPVSELDGEDASTRVEAATAVGSTLYWAEYDTLATTVKSVPLHGGAVSVIAELTRASPVTIGVTSQALFVNTPGGLQSLPLAGGSPEGGVPASVMGFDNGCQIFASDSDAVYCEDFTSSSVFRVANDGTATQLGTILLDSTLPGSGVDPIAIDDTYVYWVDAVTVGTIMRVAKSGGTPVAIAMDTSPVAIAVDSNAVYWSDLGGNIMRLTK